MPEMRAQLHGRCAPAAKAAAGASAPARQACPVPWRLPSRSSGIEVEGLDASSWAVPTESVAALKAEAVARAGEHGDRVDAGPAFVAVEPGQARLANTSCSPPETRSSTASSTSPGSKKP